MIDFETVLKRASGASDASTAKIAAMFPRGRGLAAASESQLRRLGLTPRQASRLLAAVSLARVCDGSREYRAPCTGPARAVAAIRARTDVGALESERAWVIALDSRARVIDCWEAHRGTVSSVNVHPREIFLPAIRACAHSVIFAHNHPSGDCDPSSADLELSRRLADAGKLLGIPLVDSIVITATEHTSIAALGLLQAD